MTDRETYVQTYVGYRPRGCGRGRGGQWALDGASDSGKSLWVSSSSSHLHWQW